MPLGLFDSRTPPKSTQRFDTTPELRHVCTLVLRLRQKDRELTIAAIEKGEGSIDQIKYAALSKMLLGVKDAKGKIIEAGIEDIIQKFNAEPAPQDDIEAKHAIIDFAKKMQTIVADTLQSHSADLSKQRNNNRELASNYTRLSTMAPITLAALFKPMAFVTGGLSLGLAYYGSNKICELTGLKNTDADTYRYVSELSTTLNELIRNLTENLDCEAGTRMAATC